jgi:Na+/H+ antiporter NhaD/arsenite permease-like protein
MENIDYLHNEVEKLRGSSWAINIFNIVKGKIGISIVVLVVLFILLYYIFPRKEEESIVQGSGNTFESKKVSKIEWRKLFILYIVVVILLAISLFSRGLLY